MSARQPLSKCCCSIIYRHRRGSEATQEEEAPIILPVPLTQAKGNNSLKSLHIEYIQDLP
ncbi:hypothetical protein BDW66DRAFT_138920, partial [Aspergillus desertorum]